MSQTFDVLKKIPRALGGRPVTVAGERRRYFSYADIEDFVLHCRRDVVARDYAAAVAVLRGGVHAAAMLCQSTELPLITARYERATRRVAVPLETVPPRSRLLVVEDIAGKGFTLTDVCGHLVARGHAVDVMTICHDADSRCMPDFSMRLEADERALFPWERGHLALTDIRRSHTDSDLAGWRVGFDLDGIFLPDLPDADYATRPAETLQRRHRLPALPLPTWWSAGDLIISGRLESDRVDTLDWLRRAGIDHGGLHLRPDESESAGVFKRRLCAALGVCEFFESDPDQAGVIAALPHLVVWHAAGDRLRRVHADG